MPAAIVLVWGLSPQRRRCLGPTLDGLTACERTNYTRKRCELFLVASLQLQTRCSFGLMTRFISLYVM